MELDWHETLFKNFITIIQILPMIKTNNDVAQMELIQLRYLCSVQHKPNGVRLTYIKLVHKVRTHDRVVVFMDGISIVMSHVASISRLG